MQQSSRILATAVLLFIGAVTAHAQTFVSTLSGPAENPPNASPGMGSTTIILDLGAHTLRVIANFTGLTGNTTMAHIHCCVNSPANVGVATMTPTFTAFPSGVTAGSYDRTFNTLDPATYNAPFLAGNGGNAAGAEAALAAGIQGGRAYLNIHTTVFPGGEIRGFLLAAPQTLLIPTTSQAVLGLLALLLVAATWFTLRRRRA